MGLFNDNLRKSWPKWIFRSRLLILGQPPSTMKKMFITNKMTSHFFITLFESITCISFLRSTDLSRMMITFVLSSTLITTPTYAHDPVFGLGPHVLFKGGVEVAVDILKKQSSDNQDAADVSELGLELTYGLTGDWAACIDIPFIEMK